MAQRRAPVAPQRAILTPEEMVAALPKLERRRTELREFNIASITERNDVRAEKLRHKYNDTLAEIFGADSADYENYAAANFDSAPYVMSPFGGRTDNIAEVRAGYAETMAEAIGHLDTIRELFEEKIADAGGRPDAKANRAFGDLDIHPCIAAPAAKLFSDGYYAQAVLDACKALDLFVQELSARPDLSGTALMQIAFSANNPVLKVADLSTQTGKDEQLGSMHLFSGAMLAVRNPRAHSLMIDDPNRAIEYIAFLSMLAKIADRASK